MLCMLVNKFPEIMNIIKAYLKKIVTEAERRYNADPGSYWYRFMRYEDPGITSGAEKVYWHDFSSGAAEHIVPGGGALTVPVSNAYAIFGWYLDTDFGDGGYLRIQKQDVTKSEVQARVVYMQANPKHLYLDFDSIIVGYQQEKLTFVIWNEHGEDQDAMCIPFMFRIASKSQLNLD